MLARQLGRAAHQVVGDREGRAGRERHARHRARRGSWYSRIRRRQSARIVASSCTTSSGRQPALRSSAAHRAARGVEADAQLARGRDLHVDQPLLPARKQVEVVGRGRAAGEQQLAQAHAHRGVHRIRVEQAPDLVQLGQPAEERRLLHARHVARQRLRQVVVRVDEAGQHHLAPRVDAAVDRARARARPDRAIRSSSTSTWPSAWRERRRPSGPAAARRGSASASRARGRLAPQASCHFGFRFSRNARTPSSASSVRSSRSR